jgi:hypothetical protein
MPPDSACRRYTCVVRGSCADMLGRGKGVADCTKIDVRHHGAQCVSPLRSGRIRRVVNEVPSGHS